MQKSIKVCERKVNFAFTAIYPHSHCRKTITLSTQLYTKSSCQLNLVRFQPVNSTLDFSWQQAQINKKIREPEKNSHLSEMSCFQAFFGIYFCTFDINTTHSTCFVFGKLSYAFITTGSYPSSENFSKFIAIVFGLHEI